MDEKKEITIRAGSNGKEWYIYLGGKLKTVRAKPRDIADEVKRLLPETL